LWQGGCPARPPVAQAHPIPPLQMSLVRTIF
jgi:hypothetical protein